MTYLEFHLIFIAPALVVAALMTRGAIRVLGPRAVWSVPLLAVLAFVWTTPWDNYLVANGVWSYGANRVLGTIAWVPLEEYAFFLLQPLVTGWIFQGIVSRWPAGPRPESRMTLRLGGTVAWLALALGGLVLLRTGPGTYMGLILVWAAPVAAAQWGFGEPVLRRRAGPAATAIITMTVYLCVADAIAIASGIWTIAPATSTGLQILGLPVEEAVFFLVSNILIVQGLVLFLDPPGAERAS